MKGSTSILRGILPTPVLKLRHKINNRELLRMQRSRKQWQEKIKESHLQFDYLPNLMKRVK